MCLYTSDSAHARVCVCVCSFPLQWQFLHFTLYHFRANPLPRAHYRVCSTSARPGGVRGRAQSLFKPADGSMLSFCGLIILSLQITKQNHKNKSCLTRINEVLSTRHRAARGTRGWSGPSVAGITAVCSLSLLSRFLWQGPPVLRRPSSDTCPTTLPCWKEKASF